MEDLANHLSGEKKEWTSPQIKVLSFDKTLGGSSMDTGEDNYVDPTS